MRIQANRMNPKNLPSRIMRKRYFVQVRTFLRLFAHIQMMPILEAGEETLVGGQAVMEGVMMRAPHSYCVAVRKPSGEIVSEEMPVRRLSEKNKIWKLPILRGIGTLGQAMGLGLKALRFSANAVLDEGAGEKPKEISNWALTATLLFNLLVFIAMYKLAPLYLTTQLGHKFPVLQGRIAFNAVDGLIRMVIFISFLFLISRAKDIRRVFQYHGAEHKVVFNFESGKPVTVSNAQSFVTWHPRCGTSFLLVVMVISMLTYMLIPFDSFAAKLASRIVLLPVITGLSYELIRFAAKRQGSFFMKALTAPGLWLQRITTQPPSDDQAEVAIAALNRAMVLETSQGGELVIA
jgi:uncharacterized protein YqhQ